MTIREMMKENGDNLGSCRPYVSKDGKYAIAVSGGEVCGMLLNGENVDGSALNKNDLLNRFAMAINPDYDEYSGWDDLHIALDGILEEKGCADCPWFGICEAVDGEVEDA